MGEIGVFLHPHTQAPRHLGAIFKTYSSGRQSHAATTLVNSRKQLPEKARWRRLWAQSGTPSCGPGARLVLTIGAPTYYEVPTANTSTQIDRHAALGAR